MLKLASAEIQFTTCTQDSGLLREFNDLENDTLTNIHASISGGVCTQARYKTNFLRLFSDASVSLVLPKLSQRYKRFTDTHIHVCMSIISNSKNQELNYFLALVTLLSGPFTIITSQMRLESSL